LDQFSFCGPTFPSKIEENRTSLTPAEAPVFFPRRHVELPGPGDGERFVHNMLIDNALHNQSNLTNSTKDVGNDKGWSLALPSFAKDLGLQ
jgi:hypothetical protein